MIELKMEFTDTLGRTHYSNHFYETENCFIEWFDEHYREMLKWLKHDISYDNKDRITSFHIYPSVEFDGELDIKLSRGDL